jgi:hypothetical protein
MIENLKSCLEYFKNESLACPNREIVGLWGLKDGKPVAKIVKNRAPDPQNFFAVDPLELLMFKNEHEFLAVFHSHIYGDSQFSEWDKITADNCCLPFIVYSLGEDKFNIYVPPNLEISSVNLEKVREALK